MSIDIKNIASGVSVNSGDRPEAERAEVKKLAQQFEAMLMTQMLREMQKSMLSEEEEEEQDGFGAGTLADTGNIELGLALSKKGGLGLTDSLLSAFERQIQQAKNPAGMAGDSRSIDPLSLANTASFRSLDLVAPASLDSPRMPGRLGPVTSAAPISSEFGWRNDPLTGTPRFHQGVDIAMAYGREVRAAADGVVAFAGVQGDYGTTVIVNHDGGRQTRYAHLSEQLVQAGDVVAEGQILGKSGNSGRSTGPHLHFEVLINGQPVDPTE